MLKMIDFCIDEEKEIKVSDIKNDDIVSVIIAHETKRVSSYSWDLEEKEYQYSWAYQMVYQSNLVLQLIDTETEEYSDFKEVTKKYEVSTSSKTAALIAAIMQDPYVDLDHVKVVAGEATYYDYDCGDETDKNVSLNVEFTAKRAVNITVTLKEQEIGIDYAGLRPTDKNIQNGVYHHGAEAVYFGGGAQKNIENIILGKITGAICACDREYIGNIGVDITGQVTLAATHNLFSDFDESQKRTFDAQYAHYVYTCEEDKPEFVDDSSTIGQHSEFWIEHAIVRNIWVVKNSPEEAVAEKLAAKYSLPLVKIEEPDYTYKLA